jgi:hypothetical protein
LTKASSIAGKKREDDTTILEQHQKANTTKNSESETPSEPMHE